MVELGQVAQFTDGEGYEKFMGRWSRSAGRLFLDWLSLPSGLKWLDVGCGTGAFTETIAQECAPSEIVAIDPAATQVAYAQSRHLTGITFQVLDARSLNFEAESFDVAVSALVLNFIADREKAVTEMQRVVRSGGTVAAYVWDFARKRGNSQHLSAALRQVSGRDMSGALNAESTTLERLQNLFESVGLRDVVTRPFDIQISFADFDDYWNSNTRFASPGVTALKSLTEDKQQQIKETVRANLPIDNHGAVCYSATVNAVRGHV
jgi:ubiquinone/menaquinone biosynthesis C-methylase UbiE